MRKRNIIKILICFIFILILIVDISNAMSVGDLTGTLTESETSDIKEIGNKSITVYTTIGSVVSVVTLIIIGIKYMMGSVEEKAEYKKTLMPYLIGALFIFAASTIAQVIYKVSIQL